MKPFSTAATGLAIAALLALPGLAETRVLGGQVHYHERILLPEGSLLMVEAHDAEERLLATLRAPTEGAQVPLAFALDVPTDTLLTLRAGLRWPDGGLWLTLPQDVAPGDADMHLGDLRARQTAPMGFASLLRCGATLLEVGIGADGARLRGEGGFRRLEAVPAASGARFEAPEDAGTWVWTRGAGATVSIAAAELPECSLVLPQDDLVQVWAIERLDGEALSQPERAEIGFTADGRLFASVGCNRMIGGYARHGGMLSLGQVASTLMACPAPLATEERRLTALLTEVDGYTLDGDGGMALTVHGAPVIAARVKTPD
ncbi:MAG: META domain-containing protein [Pararhodobacter sp.]|nr:META domain-containing protein [Pararhodobacter sp.]